MVTPARTDAAAAAPAAYTVRRGDTLTSIARRLWHHAGRWELLWWANRHQVRNPDVITPGERLSVPADPAPSAHIVHAALAALPKITVRHSGPWRDAHGTFTASTHAAVHHYACGDGDGDGFDMPCWKLHRGQAPAYSGGGYPGGAFGACVVARESGGNPQVMNATGHYGLYQFSAATWAAYGGSPSEFGNATVAEQNAVFATAMAEGGESNWAPYDGC